MHKDTISAGQVIHRTCIGCGHVSHYSAQGIKPEQLNAIQNQKCEDCGESEAVLMMTGRNLAAIFEVKPIPRAESSA
jgi:predicted nucleic-acid-binding Zn-ribbon protein